jgi:hypothetical protein
MCTITVDIGNSRPEFFIENKWLHQRNSFSLLVLYNYELISDAHLIHAVAIAHVERGLVGDRAAHRGDTYRQWLGLGECGAVRSIPGGGADRGGLLLGSLRRDIRRGNTETSILCFHVSVFVGYFVIGIFISRTPWNGMKYLKF